MSERASPPRSSTGMRLCQPGELPVRGIHRVLVCRPNHRLGNMVLISPLLHEIETLYPGAEIDIVSAGCAAQVLYGPRFQVRRIMNFPRRAVHHPWLAAQLVHELRGNTYDLAIDPCAGSGSGRLALRVCRARYKVGFPDSTAGGETDGPWSTAPEHLAKRSVFLLRTAYAGTTETEWPTLDVPLAPSDMQHGACALAKILGRDGCKAGTQPVIGIFGNATGPKRLPEPWWEAFTTALRARRPDVHIVEVLAEHGRSQLPGVTASFYTRDLRKLAAVLANMQGFVSADCGVMHLAAAVGTPTLGLFTQSNRSKYTPYGPRNEGIDVAAGDDGVHTAPCVAGWVDRAIGEYTTCTAQPDYPAASSL